MNHKRITTLSSAERIAGYIFYSAKLARLGARLRKNGRSDESWSLEENAKWDSICDEIDPWWYSLSEKEIQTIKIIEIFIAKLTRGEDIINTQ